LDDVIEEFLPGLRVKEKMNGFRVSLQKYGWKELLETQVDVFGQEWSERRL